MKNILKKGCLLACTALTFVLVGHAPAEAGPLAGAIAGVAGALISGAGIAQVIIGVAIKVGMSLLQMAIAGDQEQKPVGVKLQVEVGDDRPVSTTIGTFATSGRRKYIGSYGDQGGTPNSHLTEVIELGSIPVSGLAGIWIDGEKCTILWNEPSSRGYPIQEYRKNGTDYAWVRFLDGTQTAADPYLVDKFGAHEKRPWTAAMVGRGIPYAVMTYRWNRQLFRGQPSCIFELAPIPLYDIRKDSTNGGSGTHRWADPSTWEPSVNQAVMAYNVARGLQYNGTWFFGGQDVAEHRLPSSAWIAAAQECGRLIENADGTSAAQFRGGFEITGDMQPLDVLEEFRKGMNARLVDSAGQLKVKAGALGAAVYAFTDDDVIVTEAIGFDPFPPLDQTVNSVNATYPEPEEQWGAKDAPEQIDAALEARDGRRLPASLQFRAVPFEKQVQRLMRAALKDERRFRTHQLWLPPEAYLLEPGIDVVSWTSSHNGYQAKKFLVVEAEGDPTMNQLVTLKEVDPSDYDWSTAYEQPTSTGWLGRIDVPTQLVDGWQVQPATIYDAANAARRPSILVKAAGGLDDVRNIRVQVRLQSSGAVIFDSDAITYDAPYEWILNGTFLPATDYEAQGTLVPFSSRPTAPSAWIPVTTPDVKLIGDELADNAVIAQKLADSAVTASKIMDEAVTELKVANQAISTAKLALAAVTADIIANGAVLGTKLADAAVTAQKIADEAITATKFAASLKPVEIASALPSTGNVEGRMVYLTTDDKLYRYTGAAWTAAVAATDVTGQLTDAQIAAVAAAKLTGQITSTQITDGSISTPKLAAGSVSTDKLAAGSVIAEKVAAEAITAEKLAAGSVTTPKLAAGSVTADILAANSVTAGKVVAGAIGTTQLAAGAVTANIVAAGAITADKLAVGGGGRNQIVNSDFAAGMTGWAYWASGGEWLMSVVTTTYAVPTGSLQMIQTGAANYGQYADVYPLSAEGAPVKFSVAAGKRYEVSAYVFGHRSDYCRAHIEWNDALGNIVGYSFADATTHQNSDPQKNLANYARVGVIGQAPANAAYCHIFFRCRGHSVAYGIDSYTWLAFPCFGEATANQSELSPWSPTGVTLIQGGNIVTNAITALHLSTGSVTADKIAAGSVTTEKLVAGSVTGEKVAALTITGDKIAANTIGADKIAANSITAKQLVLTDFSNLVPDNQMIDATNWSGSGWGLWGDHNLAGMPSYNSARYYGGPWGSGGWSPGCVSKSFPVQAGKQYQVEGWTYSNDAFNVLVRIVWLDINGNYFGPYNDLYSGPRGAGVWSASGAFTAPTGAVTARMELYCQRDNTTGPIYVGGISVRQRNAADLIVDGAITANKLSVNSLSAVSANCGTLSAGMLISSNGKMVIDLNAGTIVISS